MEIDMENNIQIKAIKEKLRDILGLLFWTLLHGIGSLVLLGVPLDFLGMYDIADKLLDYTGRLFLLFFGVWLIVFYVSWKDSNELTQYKAEVIGLVLSIIIGLTAVIIIAN